MSFRRFHSITSVTDKYIILPEYSSHIQTISTQRHLERGTWLFIQKVIFVNPRDIFSFFSALFLLFCSNTAGLSCVPCMFSHLFALLFSAFCCGVGTVCAPRPMFWAIRLAPASWSSCLDTSSAAKTWRWETRCWRRRRGRNHTSSSPRTVILKMTNALTVNQTCSWIC